MLHAASNDLREAYYFYRKSSLSAAQEFISTAIEAIDELQHNAGIHPKPIGNYHRMLMKRFPYTIYYKIESDVVIVYAIIHGRRDPGNFQARLK